MKRIWDKNRHSHDKIPNEYPVKSFAVFSTLSSGISKPSSTPIDDIHVDAEDPLPQEEDGLNLNSTNQETSMHRAHTKT